METVRQFRENVQEAYANGLEMKFVPGQFEGPNQTGQWIGSCFVRRIYEVSARVAEANIDVVVRVFAPVSLRGTSTSSALPYDPSELEDMADRIFAVTAANQVGLGAWYMRLTSLEIDPVLCGIQATILAWDQNPAGT